MKKFPIHIEILANLSPTCRTIDALLEKSKITKQRARIRRAISELIAAGELKDLQNYGAHYTAGMHSTIHIARQDGAKHA